MVLFALPGASAAQAHQIHDIVSFRLCDHYLILVQTMVNGSGPYTFLVDTGTTRTVIDPELARQLHAPVIGKNSLTTVFDVRQDPMVRLAEVRLNEVSAFGMDAIVDQLEQVKILAPGVRGVLGEDFLSRFDILIDYKKRLLRFGEAAPAGERCRFETSGEYHGAPTSNRLLIRTEFLGVSGGKVRLQLDTGAKTLVLFPAHRDSFPSHLWGGAMAFSGGSNGNTIHSRIRIKVGTTMVQDLDLVQNRHGVAFDAVGLLPASIFRKIYISHSGGFIVLNPTE
jgi:predicted aspartyl protease